MREGERKIIQINCLLTYKCEKFLQFSTVSHFYQIRSRLKILRKGNNILTNEHQKNEDVCVCVCAYTVRDQEYSCPGIYQDYTILF